MVYKPLQCAAITGKNTVTVFLAPACPSGCSSSCNGTAANKNMCNFTFKGIICSSTIYNLRNAELVRLDRFSALHTVHAQQDIHNIPTQLSRRQQKSCTDNRLFLFECLWWAFTVTVNRHSPFHNNITDHRVSSSLQPHHTWIKNVRNLQTPPQAVLSTVPMCWQTSCLVSLLSDSLLLDDVKRDSWRSPSTLAVSGLVVSTVKTKDGNRPASLNEELYYEPGTFLYVPLIRVTFPIKQTLLFYCHFSRFLCCFGLNL